MTVQQPNREISTQLDVLAWEIYAGLAARFPVCLSSDEFHFFPQYRSARHGGAGWDDFSENAVRSFLSDAAQWRDRLEKLRPHTSDRATAVDMDLLSRVLSTLVEQLDLVQPHKTQATFYLTLLSIGLAESLEESHDAFGRRIVGLPEFLEVAMANLKHVPVVFRNMAIAMISKLRTWMVLLPMTDSQRSSAMAALNRFHDHLMRVDTPLDFRLQGDLYARVADFHMGCRMGLEEIGRHMDDEIEAATDHLVASAGRISPGTPWQTVLYELPSPQGPDKDIAAFYQGVIGRLKDHCLENGFVHGDGVAGCDVKIETIPDHMMLVRADAAYSMPPGHPPAGGTFYVLPANRQPVPRDIMLLAAHETFPGHHLLDTLRWGLPRPLRRCLEFPLFYEGWASFSEEILFDTGFFSGPADRLLMAKRRFWRAQRGRTELRIHTGQCTLEEAAKALADIGLVSGEQALAMVRRYALKPGYQLSYAIGRRKFRRLYKAFLEIGHTPAQFVQKALAEGEIGFDHLAERMLSE